MTSQRSNRWQPALSARARVACALVGWFCVLTLVPLGAHRFGWWMLVLAPVVGAYFVSWLGMLRHELWHGYVDGLDNRFFYRVTCFALCLDPETYRLSHASHHLHANTDHDRQMYPEGFLRNPRRARLQFVMELLLGNLAWEIATTARLRAHGHLAGSRIAANLPGRLVLPGLLAWIFAMVAPQAAGVAVVNFVLMFWSGSLMTRHNQWLQHLGIFASGDDRARNLLTRNLRNRTLLERAINFLNHDDSVAHTFHHTDPGSYTRLDPELQPATDHVQITLRDYGTALLGFYRELFSPSPRFPVMVLERPTGSPGEKPVAAGSGTGPASRGSVVQVSSSTTTAPWAPST